jgi:thioredoxin-dependent peroxiredoxin
MVELRKRPARDPAPAAPPSKRSSSKSSQPSKVKQVVNKAKAAVTGKPADDDLVAPEAKASDHGAGELPGTTSTPATADSKPLVSSETGALPETTGTAGQSDATAAPATANDSAAPAASAGGDPTTKLSKDSVNSTIPASELGGFGGTISTHDGREVTVAALLKEVAESPGGKGKGLVLFTYPKASTPGCTTQACLFRDNYKPIFDAGYAVYGLSSDSVKANGNFVAKQGLQYPLLVSLLVPAPWRVSCEEWR